MSLIRMSSPHTHSQNQSTKVMQWVLIALLPGILANCYFFGYGVLINLAWATVIALASEALVLKLRQRPIKFYLADYSAVVTAFLLALAIPPTAPWWLTLIGCSFAIVIGKQLYGGLGYNPFNPAMLGYVLLLISFPVEMTAWLPPRGIEGNLSNPSLVESLGFWLPSISSTVVDSFTGATPLDVVKTNTSLTLLELWQQTPVLEGYAGIGWTWVNLAFLAGGIFLLVKKVFTWHAPVAMLAALLVMSFLFYGGEGSDSHGGPLFHLLSGATMLGAFFIVTDPVSSATSKKGRLVFGASIGVLTYIIRAWGGYPDGVAFAVLLMNMAAPTIDYYTQPRTYGHKKPNRGLAKSD
ncbi:electron transport complex subunit RsxD [Spartinivicinus ruber]|uniref:electron transport complex subunit RsxD n=1 Tax=Spartinivicinus ruber TaxID=2683272 RepID=UPI0013D3FD25|nr:electron transport complex subunit RsxD [Spartinivicinus ruber]